MILGSHMNRQGKVPASAILLLVILVIAAVALFVVSRQDKTENLVLGGHIFDFENTEINGLLLTHNGAQFRIDRQQNGYWTLKGATSDFLIQNAVKRFLQELKEAQGGRVYAGTEVEDRRYEFNGPEALRLTVFSDDGKRQTLAIGTANPVTGYYYASGVGRPGCFPVTEVLHHQLSALPASLQLQVLLPRFDRQVIEAIDLQYGKETHFLRKINERWWLSRPENGTAALGSAAGSYHQQYTDRRLEHEDRTWLLASGAAVSRLIYEVSEIIVTDIPETRYGQSRLGEWELSPPWRQVTLHGAGINPDSTEASSDELIIAFGPALEGDYVPTLRRGNVLIADNEALRSLVVPLGEFLDVGALSFLVAQGDSLRIWREGKFYVGGYKGEVPQVTGGQRPRPVVESWLTTYPPRDEHLGLTDLSYNGLVRYMITNLDRMESLAVLPPVKDEQILTDHERVIIEINTTTGLERLEIGYLNKDYLPAGSRSLVGTDDGMDPVGLWRPQTGQLMQIPGHVVVTMRNYATK